MTRPLNRRLSRVENTLKAERRVRFLFRELDETRDQVRARMRDMIASGEAKRSDKFVIFSWLPSQANETGRKFENQNQCGGQAGEPPP